MNVIPYLSFADCVAAIEFYESAFGAVEVGPRLTTPNGNVVHTEIEIGESTVMLADEMPEFDNVGPKTLGGTTVRLNLRVDDADQFAQTAVAAGATIIVPVSDQFYGYRSGRLEDPFGHQWILSQKLQDLSQAEMQSRLNKIFASTS